MFLCGEKRDWALFVLSYVGHDARIAVDVARGSQRSGGVVGAMAQWAEGVVIKDTNTFFMYLHKGNIPKQCIHKYRCHKQHSRSIKLLLELGRHLPAPAQGVGVGEVLLQPSSCPPHVPQSPTTLGTLERTPVPTSSQTHHT